MQKDSVTILIDGHPVLAKADSLLIEAIRKIGLEVPALCYYPDIDPPLGTCRACTVQVNGRPQASCTTRVKAGMEVRLNTPELADNRKAIVEMMFAEGNHFCPACEKSGDCDLQGLAYELGIEQTRFPHLFVNRIIDYRPQRMVIEHNRCIRCRRCVEDIKTVDGKHVFQLSQRANRTDIIIDYEQEAKLTDAEALHAMHICPTGSILVKGQSLARPHGVRKYDRQPDKEVISKPPSIHWSRESRKKKRIATTSLAGCFGCHMSLLDIDEELLDVIELVEFHKSPLTDIKTFDQHCDLGIIEGGCCNDENVEVLRTFRQNCDILVSVGECAIWGGLPALRNFVPLEECMTEAYVNTATYTDTPALIPEDEDLPQLLDRVYSCNEVVRIDYVVPGCPPDPHYMWKVIRHLLFGEAMTITSGEFKYD